MSKIRNTYRLFTFRHMDMLGHPIVGDPDYWFSNGARTSAGHKLAAGKPRPFPALQVLNVSRLLYHS